MDYENELINIKEIHENTMYLTNILKDNNHKYTEVCYNYLSKSYWIIGEEINWFLGNNKEESEVNLLEYLNNCK